MTRSATVLAMSLAAACGTSETVTVEISPTEATLVVNTTQQFQGTQTTETSNSLEIDGNAIAFEWAIEEGLQGGGLEDAPFNSISYVYTAPPSPGTFHLTITSKRDAGATATATIMVVAPAE
jgi:hypothetical protein